MGLYGQNRLRREWPLKSRLRSVPVWTAGSFRLEMRYSTIIDR